MDIIAAYALVSPYTDRPDRLETATIYDLYATAAEAFEELDRIGQRLHGFGIAGDAIEMVVVDSERRRVARGH